MTLGRAHVIRGDARHLPLPDASVDLIVTSPPYFALRDYGYDGQIGSEPTPQAFLESLWACTREWVRVLKPEGSLWVNLGDKYSGAGRGNNTGDRLTNPPETRAARYGQLNRRQHAGLDVAPPKSLLGLPWRYALGCIDHLGLILRAEVIWDKPNGLPESVTDRPRRSHEQWFMFVRQPRYYSAVDEIREAYGAPPKVRGVYAGPIHAAASAVARDGARFNDHNPLGKLPGSVWEIPSEPLNVPDHLGVDHFAAFPSALPKRIIQGWSPPGICTECGQGRRPVVRSVKLTSRPGYNVRDQRMPGRHASGNQGREGRAGDYEATITGYACACTPYTDHAAAGTTTRRGYDPTGRGNHAQGTYGRHQAGEYERVGPWREYHLDGWTPPPTRPAVVLDPMGGTGTTALAAKALGRIGLTVDLSADYCRLAQWRVNDRGELARVLGVPKPPKPIDGQLALEVS